MKVFSVANDTTLTRLIGQAQRRINFLSPSVSMAVAKALVSCMERLDPGAVTITLDIDGEVCRLGYGEHEATTLLYEAMRKHGKELTRQAGIRIGLLLSDDTMMIFAPTPLLVEAGLRDPKPANAIILESPPSSVIQNLGLGKNGVRDQTVGLDIASKVAIDKVEANLKEDPVQNFDISRTIGIFNAYFEFVEFELQGTAISRKTIHIPSECMGFAGDEKTARRLKSSFHVIEATNDLSGDYLLENKRRIIGQFLKSLSPYGNAVLRHEKADFQKEVRCLRCAVEAYRRLIEEKLQDEMDRNRASLRETLLPGVRKNPPKECKLSDGSPFNDQKIEQWLDDKLRKAFGKADKLIGEMKVNLIFKGVTYESLKEDKEFVELAKEKFPSLNDKLLSEDKVAKARKE